MKYDFYNKEVFYKPGIAIKARDRLHDKLFQGLKFKSILEVGIGFGELAFYCKKNKREWIGIDSNQKLVEAMQTEGFSVYKSVMPTFPEVKEGYSVLFASHFIEHLDNYKQALTFLENARERLKSQGGGTLILLFPDIEKIGHYFWQDYTHSFVTSKKRIEDMLFDTDYQIVKSGRYTVCFFGILSTIISFSGKFFPFFLLPAKIRLFMKLSFQQHSYVIAKV